ncbi:MAG: Pyruvate kinase [Eubacteriales bacterium SKADARSKE-1]|nr:Pyruvate kinase [Eubacteriales bacterium SKADARSKE-1]
MRKTKIVCTLGPATDNEDTLRNLILNGMNVARLNMSHQTEILRKNRINSLKKLRKELHIPVALLLDTKGPEIRIGTFSTPKIHLKNKKKFTLYTEDIIGDENGVSISYKKLTKDIYPGIKILIDDGLIELKVVECDDNTITCVVVNGGILSANKGINIPEINLPLPFINKKDKEDIKFAVDEGFDFIAASFTRSYEDIKLLKEELSKYNGNHIKIISKIENSEGLNNIDEILRNSDGIMVARGDLGVEIPMEEIPIIQKKLISKAYDVGKHVIIATQMLDSMVKQPRPTRAETTDVANAIYDGASAIMLSAETAAGKYPVLALKTMSKIAERTERDIDYKKRFTKKDAIPITTVTAAISHATCSTAHDLGATSILTVTKTGATAEAISKYKPSCPIIAGTTSKTVMRQMNLLWGVTPILMKEKNNTDELIENIVNSAQSEGLISHGDLVVLTAGVPFGNSGTTNLLKVHLVGNILVSGLGITKSSICANLCVCADEKEARKNLKTGDILVIPAVSKKSLGLIKEASGIITEIDGRDSYAASVGLALNKPVIVGAKNATKFLHSGTTVTLNAEKGIVFSDTSCFR